MKVLLILIISCATPALCHGACMMSEPELVIKDGELVGPDSCIDPFDQSKHALGTNWNTKKCYACNCSSEGELECCTRYGGVASVEGCKAVLDEEACKYKFYKEDDPSAPCPGV